VDKAEERFFEKFEVEEKPKYLIDQEKLKELLWTNRELLI
jgi:hypothetical protein